MRTPIARVPLDVPRALRALALGVALLVSTQSYRPLFSDAKTLDPPGTSTGKHFARRSTEVGIPRFAEICPGLTRGGEPGEAGLRYLRDRGYKTIVSFLTDPAESAWVVQSGMRYVHLPIRSGLFGSDLPTDAQVRTFLSVVRDTTQYPVFIHCHAGKDRTGAMSAIYRMEMCGWTKDEAVEEMESFGFSGRYRRLKQFVQSYAVAPDTAATATATASTSAAPAPSNSSDASARVPAVPAGATPAPGAP